MYVWPNDESKREGAGGKRGACVRAGGREGRGQKEKRDLEVSRHRHHA